MQEHNEGMCKNIGVEFTLNRLLIKFIMMLKIARTPCTTYTYEKCK
jgi:hypothetical protein